MKLNELTLLDALKGLKTKQFTAVELVKACLAHIQKHDPTINAFVTVTEEYALSEAKKADAKIAKDGERAFVAAPLLGIPYACKDNFCTLGIQTTASSNILKGYIPAYESTVTERLKEAGAILIGKTNLDAFAHGSSTETSDFFTTKNPWDITRIPGGSSGGSAAAVAAHMCIFAIGSETAGSIRVPAAWCGVTGLKPSYGRVSRYGVIAMGSSLDSPGPITKTVLDSALVLEALAGKDQNDATTSPTQIDKYLSQARSYSLKGKKLGIPKSYFDLAFEEGVKEQVMVGVEKFKELGAELVDIDLLDPKYSIAVYTIIQRSEVSSNLARFDGIRYGHDRTHFGFEAKKRMMLGAYSLSAGYYDAYYAKAQKVRTKIIEDFNNAFEKVDLILGPTLPSVALPIGASAESAMFGELVDQLAEPSSIAGICGISVPTGLVRGLPVAVQVIGKMFDEASILGAAYLFQENTSYHTSFPTLKE